MIGIFGQPTPHLLGSGAAASPSYAFAAQPTSGMFLNGVNPTIARLGVTVAGTIAAGTFFANILDVGGFGDVLLRRDGAAGTLAQQNGTNPQTFRIYNTLNGADAERGYFSWLANVFTIGTEITGAGTPRNLSIISSAGMIIQTAATGTITLVPGNGVIAPQAANIIRWDTRSRISSPVDGVLLVANNAAGAAATRTIGTTLALLIAPATAGAGARAIITDALAPAFGVAAVGGGTVLIPVHSNGAAWIVG